MRSNFAKTLFVAVTALVATTSVDAQSHRNRKMQQQKLEQGHVIQSNQMMPAYNAPARYDVQGGWDMWFRGDFVYMQTLADNVAYGVSSTDAAPGNPVLDGQVLLQDFDWHPGFKVSLGYNSMHDDWGVFAEYMRYIARDSTGSTFPTGGTLFSTTTTNPDTTSRGCSRIDSTYGLTYNVWDLMLDRAYYVGKRLTFDFMAGLRGSWIKQKLGTENVEQADGDGTSHVKMDSNSWGIGPRFGLNTNWLIGSGFRIFGNVAGALEWNRFNSSLRETNPSFSYTPATHSAGIVTTVNSDNNHQVRPNTDFALGFGWGTYFDNSNWHVDLVLAYEFHYWWDQNMMMNFVDDVQRGKFVQGGDLGIHGGSFGLRFDF